MAVMGSLVLLRHAKSSWEGDLDDHDRPLAARGQRDAPVAGDALRARGVRPDLVICSTAQRTRQTWAGLRLTTEALRYDRRLYAARSGELLRLVHEVPSEIGTLMLIGHAPGVVDLADQLAAPDSEASAVTRLRQKYPTAGLAIFETAQPWPSLTQARLMHFLTPRENYRTHPSAPE
jgi:phosphohistidine phosphatase